MEENLQPLKANFQKEQSKFIFGDSFTCGIRWSEFNYWFHKGYAQFKVFSGDTSKKLLHYGTNIEKQKIRRGFTVCWC